MIHECPHTYLTHKPTHTHVDTVMFVCACESVYMIPCVCTCECVCDIRTSGDLSVCVVNYTKFCLPQTIYNTMLITLNVYTCSGSVHGETKFVIQIHIHIYTLKPPVSTQPDRQSLSNVTIDIYEILTVKIFVDIIM